jgi:hypothetical protein
VVQRLFQPDLQWHTGIGTLSAQLRISHAPNEPPISSHFSSHLEPTVRRKVMLGTYVLTCKYRTDSEGFAASPLQLQYTFHCEQQLSFLFNIGSHLVERDFHTQAKKWLPAPHRSPSLETQSQKNAYLVLDRWRSSRRSMCTD